VIIADNGSTDATRSVVMAMASRKDAPRVQYLAVARRGKSYAVNAALQEARGDILALTDDDVVPDPAWLDGLVAALDETGADFVAGRLLPVWETDPPRWLSRSLYGVLAVPDNGDRRLTITEGGSQIVPLGANMAVRRLVVDRVGGLRVDLGKLDGTLRTGEDHEWFLRMIHAGFRGVYEPKARVFHWVPAERLQRSYFRRWVFQNGRDVARLEESYVSRVPRLLGVPRYMWREALAEARRAAIATARGDEPGRFAACARILWFGGYARESWL
jgi:glycosyltransferase involved in cell wall biosynthesis